MSNLHLKLRELIEPLVQSLGFDFWGLEVMMGGNRPTIRVYIEADEGVTVDQCGEVSREIGATLDVANIPDGEYVLEVSSPGLDRILFDLRQCSKYVGHTVSVVLISALEGRRRYKGALMSATGDSVVIGDESAQLEIPFHKVKRMRVVPQFNK